MLFDLEPYFPFAAYVALCFAVCTAIVCWPSRKR